jgi:hypothetical protein
MKILRRKAMKPMRWLVGAAIGVIMLGSAFSAGALAMDAQPSAAPVASGAMTPPVSAAAAATVQPPAPVPKPGSWTVLRPAQPAPSPSADTIPNLPAAVSVAPATSSAARAPAPRVAALSPPGSPSSGATQDSTRLTPPHSGASDGSAAAPPAEQPTPGQEALRLTRDQSVVLDPRNWAVMAYKSRHELVVYFEGHLYKKYHAVFGRSLEAGGKEWSGDRRTPEGVYRIIRKRPNRRWRYFLQIDYPNDYDRAVYHEMLLEGQVPKSHGRATPEGGAVGIHGTDVPILNSGNINWTTGCISVDNGAIDELEALLPVGALVVIKP